MRYRGLFRGTMFLLLSVGIALPGFSARADEELPFENAWTEITPSVVWCDDPDTLVDIEVHIVGRTDVAEAWIPNGSYGEIIDLYDDGTHGDTTAGDRVFSNSDVLLYCNPDWLARMGPYRTWASSVHVRLTDGRELVHGVGVNVGIVHQDFKGSFEVEHFGNGLSATAYAFFIEDSQHEVFDDYPVTDLYCGRGNYDAFLKFYSVMPDDFDFVMLMPGMRIVRPNSFAENVPYDVLVSNAVQNIGVDIMDNSAQFGSDGRLKSMIYHSFGSLAIFDHEVLHSWGAGMGYSLGLIDTDGNQSHWNKLGDIAGQLSSFYFADSGDIGRFAYNGDETWHLVSNMEVPPYAPLELYMMGLIPPEEVPPIHILQSPDLSDLERITAASYRTITIEQIMAAEGGARIPSAAEAQKDFTLAFIVAQDLPYTDAGYAFFSLMAYDLMSQDPPREYSSLAPFYWATGGLATLSTRLPVDLPEPTGPDPLLAPTQAPIETQAPSETQEATEEPLAATEEPEVIEEPTEPAAPGFPAFCPSVLVGLVLLPGFVLLRRKKR